MKNFLNIHDVVNAEQLAQEAIAIKQQKFANKSIGKDKTMVLLFLNSKHC